MSPSEALSTCTSPLKTARVFNPTRPEYYLADVEKAAAVAPKADPAVIVTLSEQAKAALKA